jgi:hypothetical protein
LSRSVFNKKYIEIISGFCYNYPFIKEEYLMTTRPDSFPPVLPSVLSFDLQEYITAIRPELPLSPLEISFASPYDFQEYLRDKRLVIIPAGTELTIKGIPVFTAEREAQGSLPEKVSNCVPFNRFQYICNALLSPLAAKVNIFTDKTALFDYRIDEQRELHLQHNAPVTLAYITEAPIVVRPQDLITAMIASSRFMTIFAPQQILRLTGVKPPESLQKIDDLVYSILSSETPKEYQLFMGPHAVNNASTSDEIGISCNDGIEIGMFSKNYIDEGHVFSINSLHKWVEEKGALWLRAGQPLVIEDPALGIFQPDTEEFIDILNRLLAVTGKQLESHISIECESTTQFGAGRIQQVFSEEMGYVPMPNTIMIDPGSLALALIHFHRFHLHMEKGRALRLSLTEEEYNQLGAQLEDSQKNTGNLLEEFLNEYVEGHTWYISKHTEYNLFSHIEEYMNQDGDTVEITKYFLDLFDNNNPWIIGVEPNAGCLIMALMNKYPNIKEPLLEGDVKAYTQILFLALYLYCNEGGLGEDSIFFKNPAEIDAAFQNPEFVAALTALKADPLLLQQMEQWMGMAPDAFEEIDVKVYDKASPIRKVFETLR